MEGENRENKLLVQTVYMPKLKPDKEGERRTQQKSRPNQQLKLINLCQDRDSRL